MSRQQRQLNISRKETTQVRVILFNNKSTNRNHEKMKSLHRGYTLDAYISAHS